MSVRSDITRSVSGISAPIAPNEFGCFSWVDMCDTQERLEPLKNSNYALNAAAKELLKLFGRDVESVCSFCDIEQEITLVGRDWYNERADLMLTGRTLVGAPPLGDRQPEGHINSVKERVLKYLRDVKTEADKFELDITAAERRDETALNRYVFVRTGERSDIAVDNNAKFMDIMRKTALWNNLVCLSHEKPFKGMRGCGKSVRLSLESISNEKNDNLLSIGGTREEKLLFLIIAASAVHAVYRYGDLLCAVVASAGNENRFYADEAPLATLGVSLGEELTDVFAAIEAGGKAEKGKKRDFADLDAGIPAKWKYHGNETSSVAIWGEAFVFRIPGSSADLSMFVTVMNTIVADSIAMICERIKKELAKGKGDKRAAATADGGDNQQVDVATRKQDITDAAVSVLSDVIKESKPILFEGDCRSAEWAKEAQTRGLPSAASVHEALKALISPKTVDLFKCRKVLSEAELTAMYESRLNRYCNTLDVEIKTLIDMVDTRVLPSAYNYQTDIASGLEVLRVLADDMTIEMADGALEDRKEMFEKLTADIYRVRKGLKDLSAAADKARGMEIVDRAAYLFKEIKPRMDNVRRYVDALEGSVPDDAWPLPKYREMFFIL